MNEAPSPPATAPIRRRRISTPAERMARAKLAADKAVVRLEKARQREAKAAARLTLKTRQVEKYEAISKQRHRKLDTRRKIIAGALALEHMLFDGRYGQVFRALIDEYVTRDQDRALFDLPPLPDNDPRRANPRVY